MRTAADFDLDAVRLSPDETVADIALGEFVAERRLKKTRS
jgi:hypothetical protein